MNTFALVRWYITFSYNNNAWPVTAPFEPQGSVISRPTWIPTLVLPDKRGKPPHTPTLQEECPSREWSNSAGPEPAFPGSGPQLFCVWVLHFCSQICSSWHTHMPSPGGVMWNSRPRGLYLSNTSNSPLLWKPIKLNFSHVRLWALWEKEKQAYGSQASKSALWDKIWPPVNQPMV